MVVLVEHRTRRVLPHVLEEALLTFKIKGYVPAEAKGPSSLSVRACERYLTEDPEATRTAAIQHGHCYDL